MREKYKHGELNPIVGKPAGKFEGENFMTPNVLGYYKIRKGHAELSNGEGFKRNTIWGVTVEPDTPDRAMSKCCHSKFEALDYIRHLS